MKDVFKNIITVLKTHKIIDTVAVVVVAAVAITVAVAVNRGVTAETVALVDSSSTASVASSTDSSVTSSSTASVSSVTSTPTTSTATKASTAPASPAKQTSSAVTPKAETSSRKASSTVSKTTTSKTSISSTKASSTTTVNPLYVSIPQSQELKYLSIAGGKLVLNVNAFGISGDVSSADVQQYLCDDAYYSVTEKSTGKVMMSSQNGMIDNSKMIGIVSTLETYEHNGNYWLKPATYTIHVWCQKGELSQNTNAGRPQKVDVCTFTVSVYERGFRI